MEINDNDITIGAEIVSAFENEMIKPNEAMIYKRPRKLVDNSFNKYDASQVQNSPSHILYEDDA